MISDLLHTRPQYIGLFTTMALHSFLLYILLTKQTNQTAYAFGIPRPHQ